MKRNKINLRLFFFFFFKSWSLLRGVIEFNMWLTRKDHQYFSTDRVSFIAVEISLLHEEIAILAICYLQKQQAIHLVLLVVLSWEQSPESPERPYTERKERREKPYAWVSPLDYMPGQYSPAQFMSRSLTQKSAGLLSDPGLACVLVSWFKKCQESYMTE